MGWEANVFPLLIAGNTVVINGQGLIEYNGPVAINNVVTSDTPFAFIDSAGNSILPGVTVYGFDAATGSGYIAIQEWEGSIIWYKAPTMAGPWLAESVLQWNESTGFLMQDSSGFGIEIEALNGGNVTLIGKSLIGEKAASGQTGFIPFEQVEITDHPNANNGTLGLTALWTIDASDASVGTIYEIKTSFNGVFETASLEMVPALGGTSIATSAGDTIANGWLAAGTGFSGSVLLRAMVTATGAAGTIDYFIEGSASPNVAHTSTAAMTLNSQSTGMPFNTTVVNTLRINSVWGAAVAGQTVTGHGSTFTRKGP
jgi:hypothetical protein